LARLLINMISGVKRSHAEGIVPAADLEAHLFPFSICTPFSPATLSSAILAPDINWTKTLWLIVTT